MSSPARRSAIVPPGVGEDPAALLPGDGFVASGGYVLDRRGRRRR